MTPADAKDWWLAAAALSSALVSTTQARAETLLANAPEKAGVVSGIQPGVRTATGERVLYVGSDMYRGEKIVTDGTGSLHILFSDQSSISLGPNSEITLDEFVYDPNSKRGKIGVTLGSGLLRVVGGQISKNTATTVKTASGTIGIRGGIGVVEARDNSNITSTFLFGQQMQVTDNSGNTTNITRPGFGVSMSGGGLNDSPARTSVSSLTQTLSRLGSDPSNPIGGGSSGGLQGAGSNLIATSDRPGGQSSLTGLAPDRINTQTDTVANNPTSNNTSAGTEIAQNTLRQTLGTPPTTTTS